MRIVQAVSPAPHGGLERVVLGLASGLAELGHELTVLAVTASGDEESAFVDDVRKSGIRLERLVIPPRRYLHESWRTRSYLRSEAPDLVHTHGYRPDVVTGAVARSLRIPTVSSAHGFTGGHWKNRAYEWLQCQSLARADQVIAVSRSVAERLAQAGVPSHSIKVIPNAWVPLHRRLDRAMARERLGLVEGPIHLAWVGRLSHEKGADVAVSAMHQIPASQREGLHLSIVGDGRERAELERQVCRLGLSEQVTFHGPIPDAGSLLTAFDGMLITSRTEGTPIVLFEAMAAQVPLIATRVGGIPDVLDMDSAILVSPSDAAGIGKAITQLVLAPGAAKERASRATEVLTTRFGAAPWIEAHEALFETVVQSRITNPDSAGRPRNRLRRW